jgi:WhiB family transcriptional regulator, redox-sensing transcriptional regulator
MIDQDGKWRERAECRRAPAELFITKGDDDDEPPYPPPETMRYCNVCPVRPDCLDYALENDCDGVWGGTTKFQREQLKRKRSRSTCPGCGADDSIVGRGQQQELCLACGYSWYAF